jgi:DNA-binding XRE family transcriptional regulator
MYAFFGHGRRALYLKAKILGWADRGGSVAVWTPAGFVVTIGGGHRVFQKRNGLQRQVITHDDDQLSDISCQFYKIRMICHVFCMARASRAASGLPPQSQRAIAQLGKNIALARRRRKIPQRLMAERMLVSVQTVQRLEAGDPTVGLAVLASALHVIGMTARLAELVAPESDRTGISEDLARLPKTTHAVSNDELDF